MKGIDERKIPLSIFLDLYKAFDTLNPKILLSKLQHYGIHNTSLKWSHSYLTDRKQYVECDNATSKCLPIWAGVPHWSILGPLLFIIYELYQCIQLRIQFYFICWWYYHGKFYVHLHRYIKSKRVNHVK